MADKVIVNSNNEIILENGNAYSIVESDAISGVYSIETSTGKTDLDGCTNRVFVLKGLTLAEISRFSIYYLAGRNSAYGGVLHICYDKNASPTGLLTATTGSRGNTATMTINYIETPSSTDKVYWNYKDGVLTVSTGNYTMYPTIQTYYNGTYGYFVE